MTKAFVTVLRHALDDSGLFDRAGWSTVLGVREAEIEAWLRETVFPRASTLRRIIRTLEEGAPESFVEFQGIMGRSLLEIAPHVFAGASCEVRLEQVVAPFDRTLAHYVAFPIRAAFLELLDTLDPRSQEEVLMVASALARRKREVSAWK
jgi:hypothetical protein